MLSFLKTIFNQSIFQINIKRNIFGRKKYKKKNTFFFLQI